MAVDLSMLHRARDAMKPPRILLYGVQGVGKTSFAAGAPKPVFMAFEEGTASVPEAVQTPPIHDVANAMEWLEFLRTGAHDRETLVMDTLDWLEPLVWAETCRRNGWRTIEEPGFGKGYTAANDVWRQILAAMERLRAERNMILISLAHSTIKRFENPTTEAYDRYEIKLQKGASALVQENADVVAFCNYRLATTKSKNAGPQDRIRALGSGERAIFLEERPAFLAKSRLGHPPEIAFPPGPAGWQHFLSTMNSNQQAAA